MSWFYWGFILCLEVTSSRGVTVGKKLLYFVFRKRAWVLPSGEREKKSICAHTRPVGLANVADYFSAAENDKKHVLVRINKAVC